MVLTPQNDGGLAVDVAWGSSATLGTQTTMLNTATEPQGVDVSTLAVDLLSPRTFDAAAELSGHGILFVLLDRVDADEFRCRPRVPRGGDHGPRSTIRIRAGRRDR